MNPVDLSGMLADHDASGVYFIAESGRDALADAAARLEFAFKPVDLEGCEDKEAALARIAQALDFPAWFGGNWDALADCLDDLSWLPAPGYVLVLEHTHAWKAAEPVAFDVLLDIGNDIAARWAEHGVPFWMLFPVPAGQIAPEA